MSLFPGAFRRKCDGFVMEENPEYFVTRGQVVHEENDWTRNEWLCWPGLTPAEKLLMVRARMKPGHCPPFHLHPHREEIIHIVEGKAEQWVRNE